MHIHGTAHQTVPYNGGLGVQSVLNSVNYWVQYNNCPGSPVVTQIPDVNLTDLSTITATTYSNCDNSSEVVLYTVNGGTHTWPGRHRPGRNQSRHKRQLRYLELL